MNVVENCEVKHVIEDEGGNCPGDKENYPVLLKAMRETLGDGIVISVASSAAFPNTGK